jgi:hypothetical protein
MRGVNQERPKKDKKNKSKLEKKKKISKAGIAQ